MEFRIAEWTGTLVAAAVLWGAGILSFLFVDPGNGNYEPPGAFLFWWMPLLAVAVPPYLVIRKLLIGWKRLVALVVWTTLVLLLAWWEFLLYCARMMSTW